MTGPLDESVRTWRADTPGCRSRVHFNNAGAALMPAPVHRAITEHLALESEIGGYEAADARREGVEGARTAVAQLVAAHPRNIAFTSSATGAFVQALSSFDLGPGDVVVTTRADYTSHQIQFLALGRRRGVRIVHAADLPEGGVDPQAVRDILRREHVRLVHLSWVPTHSGLVQDAHAVGAVCEEFDVPFAVDACQAVGQLPIDVAALRCDYLSATARKFLRGPRGIGFLFASDRAMARGDHPLYLDMRGAQWTTAESYRISESATRYEEWETAYALVLGLGAAATYASEVGIDVAHARAWALAADLRSRLASIRGVRVLDPGRAPCAIVTAAIAGVGAQSVVERLRGQAINTSATLRWYGLLSFAASDVDTAVRLSPHYYNTESEVELVAGAIGGLQSCLAC